LVIFRLPLQGGCLFIFASYPRRFRFLSQGVAIGLMIYKAFSLDMIILIPLLTQGVAIGLMIYKAFSLDMIILIPLLTQGVAVGLMKYKAFSLDMIILISLLIPRRCRWVDDIQGFQPSGTMIITTDSKKIRMPIRAESPTYHQPNGNALG